MRDPEEVERLLSYNRWANSRTLDVAAGLSPEEFARALGGSFASVRLTLAHIYGADRVWLERWRGTSPPALPGVDEGWPVEELREKWEALERDRSAFLGGLGREELAREIAYVNFRGDHLEYPLGDLLVHVVNHSTYHRGQVTTLVRQLGRPATGTDYVLYLGERKKSGKP